MRRMAETTAPDLDDLYRHEAARLWRAVFAYAQDRAITDRAITDDAVAEAFARCLRRGSEVRDPRAWIWRASLRMAAGELKGRRGISPQGGTLAPGVFVVPVHVLDGSKQVIGTDVFTVGPGTASDGRVGQLVITDVQPA